MSISSLVNKESDAEPYNLNQVWFREFTNGTGQTVLLQLYSPSGKFTYHHRQLLGKLFGESYPKGYWVSQESFDRAMKRRKVYYTGKLKKNAWTLSALVNDSTLKDNDIRRYFSPGQEEEIIARLEAELIENLAREKIRIINALKAEPGAEDAEFHFVKVNLTDENEPGHEGTIKALGFFATNTPTLPLLDHAKSQIKVEIPVAARSADNDASSASSDVSMKTQYCTSLPFYMPAYEGENLDEPFCHLLP